jgi:hypothetical protein
LTVGFQMGIDWVSRAGWDAPRCQVWTMGHTDRPQHFESHLVPQDLGTTPKPLTTSHSDKRRDSAVDDRY